MDPSNPLSRDDDEEALLQQIGHPRGTLLIVAIFGLLFALGWIAFYVLGFMSRGALRP